MLLSDGNWQAIEESCVVKIREDSQLGEMGFLFQLYTTSKNTWTAKESGLSEV